MIRGEEEPQTEQQPDDRGSAAAAGAGGLSGVVDEVEVRGHIVDSLLLPKILDRILQMGGTFEIRECRIGAPVRPKLCPDRHRGRDREAIGDPRRSGRARRLAGGSRGRHGVPPTSPVRSRGFYSTTNQRTQVRLRGRWVDVEDQEMDCGIVVDPATGRPVACR